MSPTEAAHHASVYSESSVPSVLLCFCALSSPFLSLSLSSASWAGQVLQMPLNFSLSFILCNTPASVPLAFSSFRTYNIYISTRTQRKMIPVQKRFDELTNHHFTFCSSSMMSQSAHRNSLCLCAHIRDRLWET